MKKFNVSIKNIQGKRTVTVRAKSSINALLNVARKIDSAQEIQLVARPA